jgi:aldose sugar dehydrogenase
VLLALVAVITLSGARLASPVWELEPHPRNIMLLIGAVYLLTVAVLAFGRALGRSASLFQVVLVGVAASAPLFVATLFYFPTFSRTPLVVGPVLAVALAWLTVSAGGRSSLRLAVVGALAVIGVGLQLAIAQGRFADEPQPRRVTSRINSALYGLTASAFENYIPRPETNQGGISLFADGYLVATGDGDVYVYRRKKEDNSISVEHIPTRIPLNSADFRAAAASTDVNLNFFRVADILAQESPGSFRLFVSHHYWKVDEQCWVMRVSTLEGRYDSFNAEANPADLQWTTLFETKPCVPLATKERPAKFDGLFNGGRLVLLNDHELLLSTGDHAMEGFGFSTAASQDPEGSYGKTVLINLQDHNSSIYSSGHRNPEGLLLAPDGTLWETEHGPRGGDELNRVEKGHNYGWPLATYGVEYGTHGWPLSAKPGSHDGFDEPFYSWYPSIGPSNLIEVTSPRFPSWRGDLLVSSLAGQSLFRMRLRENRIVHTEQIIIGERIRDILEGHDGELVLWTDRESMIFLEPESASSAASGEALYEACAACHVPAAAGVPSVGPSLKGVFGRAVASQPGFEYSGALRGLGGSWTKERLDAFLLNPAAFAPGTTMLFGGIPDAGSRASLIDYLTAPESRLEVAPPRTGVD